MKYLQKRSSVFYFRRGIPPDLRRFFKGKREFYWSLRTGDLCDAYSKAGPLVKMTDRMLAEAASGVLPASGYSYAELRQTAEALGVGYEHVDYNASVEDVFARLGPKLGFVERFGAADRKTMAAVLGTERPALPLSQVHARFEELARDRYRHLSVREQQKKRKPEELAVREAVKVLGDLDILTASKREAQTLRQRLLDRVDAGAIGVGTANKQLMHVRKIVGRVLADDGYDIANPFAGVKISEQEKAKRPAMSEAEIKGVVAKLEASGLNVEIKALILAGIDTGATLKELCLLDPAEDIRLDEPIPHIVIRRGAYRTSTKTSFRERAIPLVGHALQAFRACPGGFPRYRRDNGGEAASALANKLLGPLTGGKTFYSLRHAFADRLRAAGVSDSLKDALMGHQTPGMGAHYGSGYTLATKLEALEKSIA